jgi:hypothetical protein
MEDYHPVLNQQWHGALLVAWTYYTYKGLYIRSEFLLSEHLQSSSLSCSPPPQLTE